METTITKDTYEAFRQGDHKAFEVIFRMYFGKVKYFLGGIIKSKADAEEIAQDIFCKMWMNRENIDLSKNINAFLRVTARNAALNHIEKEKVRSSFASDQQKIQSDDMFSATADEIMSSRELELLIRLTVDKMPQKRRTIYELSKQTGLTHEEISDKLGISVKTVHNQLSLALAEIKKAIAIITLSLFFIPQTPTNQRIDKKSKNNSQISREESPSHLFINMKAHSKRGQQ